MATAEGPKVSMVAPVAAGGGDCGGDGERRAPRGPREAPQEADVVALVWPSAPDVG